MNEKLVEQVARALAVQDGIQICSDASYAQSSYRSRAQAAIAAHSAFIREAAERMEIKVAGAMAVQETLPSDWDDIDADDQREAIEWAELSFRAMLDQIERTPDATRT